MQLLELEDTSVIDMTTQGEEGKTQLQAMLGNLDIVNTLQEVDTTIGTADECSMKIEDWLQKCQELFPNVKTIHTSVKVQETIREALEMMTTETGATADPVHLGDSASSIMNKVQGITGEIPKKQLTGQRGHTYRNTKLLWVWNKGQPEEWVKGGDYESNDGKGGAPLLPDPQGQYRWSGRAGTVWSLWGPGDPRCAQFAIATRVVPSG
ncbi:uncharacterized protein [Procambarus clarkii]|uniref:uncharacterized protein n=1 Tax=Procambarus clarkii TaxID=6728 RepID=UPI0037441080